MLRMPASLNGEGSLPCPLCLWVGYSVSEHSGQDGWRTKWNNECRGACYLITSRINRPKWLLRIWKWRWKRKKKKGNGRYEGVEGWRGGGGEKNKRNNLVLYVCVKYNVLKIANVTIELCNWKSTVWVPWISSVLCLGLISQYRKLAS